MLDELRDLQVFYINIGGGEPMIRRDFFELVEYSVGNGIGVKFSTNGAFIDAEKARRLAAMDYLDIQISLDGVDAATNDAVRGVGSYDMARRAMDNLAAADFGPFKISVVVTRQNVAQLDEFKALADSYGAQLRVTRLRPSGRGADSWDDLHPTNAQQREIYDWLHAQRRERAHRRLVLPPQRARRPAARPEHVRRRPGGVPHRPDRRRVRLPVRHPRRVQGRQRPRPRRLRRGVEAQRPVPRCANRSRPAPAPVCGSSTPARAGAWRPSSSPACRSTAPTPSASAATARWRWPQLAAVPVVLKPRPDAGPHQTEPAARRHLTCTT